MLKVLHTNNADSEERHSWTFCWWTWKWKLDSSTKPFLYWIWILAYSTGKADWILKIHVQYLD